MKRWGVHLCPLSKSCRQWAAPPRLHITTPWGSLGIALTRDAKFTSVRRNDDGVHVYAKPTWFSTRRRSR